MNIVNLTIIGLLKYMFGATYNYLDQFLRGRGVE